MNNKRKHLKMACLASVAVLLGACSSTPDVKKQASIDLETSMTKQPIELAAMNSPKPISMDLVVPKTVTVSRKPPPVAAKKTPVKRKVATRQALPAPRKAYVPPKPIVVAVHTRAKPVANTIRRPASVRKVVSVPKKPSLRRPSLPRASAAMAVGAPVIRPATVPRSNIRRSVYTAPKPAVRRVANNQQQIRQQQARVKWEKDQQALAYRVKWERDQQVKAQQQQERSQQQQAQAYRAKWERDQQVKAQQQARIQQARQQQARQQQARQQQARVQQASYQPRVNNAVVQRPVNNYSQSRLTGDFAGNPRAEAFVRMMASRHGFAQSYVAGVLSRAEATPWLRKQAYKDANPVKRTKKSRGPSWSNYRRRFITSKHINTGTAFYNRHRRSLQRAEAQYGVPSEYILGIMGVETIYGGNVGSDRAIDALATLGFMNARRGNYFTSELESYFLMTRRARLDPLQPKASWAGALGLPQFMPSNIKKYGVDYDGDGAVNLWTPQDAIGSVANYLRSHGWKPGEIAAIPAVKTGSRGYSRLKNGFKYKHSLSKLARNGLRPAYAGVSGNVNMVKLRTNRGNEYWVGGNNFYVITRYNHSSHYAMAVHQLAQEIRKRVKPMRSNMPRVIEASADQDLLRQVANTLL